MTSIQVAYFICLTQVLKSQNQMPDQSRHDYNKIMQSIQLRVPKGEDSEIVALFFKVNSMQNMTLHYQSSYIYFPVHYF